MSNQDFPAPSDGFVLTYTQISKDPKASCAWYEKMLDGKVVMETDNEGTPCIIKVANTWIIINIGGGEPTKDKPTIDVGVKEDQETLTNFLNVRVADVMDFYESRKELGAEFLTEPQDMGREIRCYMKDPDGYLIEVGESK